MMIDGVFVVCLCVIERTIINCYCLLLGMFLYDDKNHFHWFNLDSLESEQQYHLIGILLGLAIYNNVILDVRFPLVIYSKLLGCNATFYDLNSSHPVSFFVC